MSILVTGSSGYIGSGLVSKLRLNGINVAACDFASTDFEEALDYRELDLSRYSTIVHLAGHSSVPQSEANPEVSWSNNVEGFKRIVDNLTQSQTLIYASSSSVYGITTRPVGEHEAKIDSIMHYDMQKTIVDAIALHAVENGKRVFGLRFGTVSGLSPKTRWDLVVNAMVRSAKESNRVFLRNRRINRPLLFLGDAYRAIELILLSSDSVPGVYNLASDNFQIGQIADEVSKLTGCEVVEGPDDPRPYDFQINCQKFLSSFGEFRHDSLERVVKELMSFDFMRS